MPMSFIKRVEIMDIEELTDDELIKLASTDFESVLKSRGYKFGWYKPTEYVGYIYVMVNPNWKEKDTNKEMVKIGYADNLPKRVRDFSGTGYPYPSHCYAAYKVQNRLEDKDVHRLIDGLDPDLRHDVGKEYYVMDKERAYSILESIAKVSGTIDCLELNPLNDEYFGVGNTIGDGDSDYKKEQNVGQTGKKRPPMNFLDMGLKVGDELEYINDTSIKVKIVDGRHVEYNEETTSLSKVAEKLGHLRVAGTAFFSYKGEQLGQIASRTVWKGLERGHFTKRKK